MCNNDKPVIYFGNKGFIEVTNETTAGSVFTRNEAIIYGTTGQRIYES